MKRDRYFFVRGLKKSSTTSLSAVSIPYLEDYDVEFGREETKQRGVCTHGNGYAESSDLDLKQRKLESLVLLFS